MYCCEATNEAVQLLTRLLVDLNLLHETLVRTFNFFSAKLLIELLEYLVTATKNNGRASGH